MLGGRYRPLPMDHFNGPIFSTIPCSCPNRSITPSGQTNYSTSMPPHVLRIRSPEAEEEEEEEVDEDNGLRTAWGSNVLK